MFRALQVISVQAPRNRPERGKGPHAPKFIAYLIVFCFEKGMSQPKYRCSLEVKLFGPSNCRYLSTSDCYVKTDCPNALVTVARSRWKVALLWKWSWTGKGCKSRRNQCHTHMHAGAGMHAGRRTCKQIRRVQRKLPVTERWDKVACGTTANPARVCSRGPMLLGTAVKRDRVLHRCEARFSRVQCLFSSSPFLDRPEE